MTQTNSEYINNEKENKLQLGDKIAFVIIAILFSLSFIGIILDLFFF